ncbi:MAG: ABC transporter ATP-binding protein [Chloroflexota bacterium]|nr:ABC transporter ATP-binding protein [Chloroflexota bacterium]
MSVVNVRNLIRDYRSGSQTTRALDGLSFEVQEGTVCGVLGPNGSGKTTTVRILATLLTPTSGSASIKGHDVAREARHVRALIGLVLGGDRGFYPALTGGQNLRYWGALRGFSPAETDGRLAEALEAVDLLSAKDTPVERYSRGMRQRLHLARATLGNPAVLLLDEPTIGLDPEIARGVRQLVVEAASRGTAVVLTTHYMQEADELCDDLVLIKQGRKIAAGTPEEIKAELGTGTVLDAVVPQSEVTVRERLNGVGGTQLLSVRPQGLDTGLTLLLERDESEHYALEAIAGLAGHVIAQRTTSLEEAYLALLSAA